MIEACAEGADVLGSRQRRGRVGGEPKGGQPQHGDHRRPTATEAIYAPRPVEIVGQMARKQRNPPVAQLETLGSSSVWTILLAPIFFTSIALLVDLNRDIHMDSMKFHASHCSWPLSCHLQDSTLSFQLIPQAQLLRHIHLSANIHGSSELMTKLPGYEIQLLIDAVDRNGNVTQAVLKVTKSKRYFANGIELGGLTTDPPWFLEKNTFLQGSIKITSSTTSIASDILTNSVFILEYQRISFTSLRAFIQVFLSLLSCVILVFWVSRLFLHHLHLRDTSPLSKTKRCCGCLGPYRCCLNYLLPEQVWESQPHMPSLRIPDLHDAHVSMSDSLAGFTRSFHNSDRNVRWLHQCWL